MEKLPALKEGRIRAEVLKHLVRIEAELKIIPEKQYLELAGLLQEISKMINGWIKYMQESPQR